MIWTKSISCQVDELGAVAVAARLVTSSHAHYHYKSHYAITNPIISPGAWQHSQNLEGTPT